MRRVLRIILLFAVMCALCFGTAGSCSGADEPGTAATGSGGTAGRPGGVAFLSGAGLFSSIRNPLNPESVYPFKTHREISPGELDASGCDPARLEAIITEIDRRYTAESDDPLAPVKLRAALKRLHEEYDIFLTRLTLMNVQYERDIYDKTLSRELVRLTAACSDLSDQAMTCMGRVLAGPYHDILANELNASEENTLREHAPAPELLPLARKETRLIQKYDRIISRDLPLAQTAAEALPVFQGLVAVRTETARICGYENYADYADTVLYGRDYTGADLQQLHSAVREHIVPIYAERTKAFAGTELISDHRADPERILKDLGPCIAQIDPALKESYHYLRRNRVSDLADDPRKPEMGYTDTLPQYGSAFIFNTPVGDEADYTDLVHEFGHFNAIFHDPTPALFAEDAMDTEELQSQGLEMLFLDFYDELFGQDAAVLQEETLLGILDSVITGCMSDEFQRTVYTHPDMSAEEIVALAARLCAEYGQIDAGSITAEEAPFDWMLTEHNFNSPLYYISYATSGLSALDLYLMAQQNREATTTAYMKVSAMGCGEPYRRAVSCCGLRDIFATDTVPAIASQLAELQP